MANSTELDGSAALGAESALRRMLRGWAGFVGIGLVLYAGLYVVAEDRVRATGEANRFFQSWSSPPQTFDHVILGASHAMPLGYGGMEEVLEESSGTSIMNLSNEGAGVVVNSFVLDHFLRRHQARNVIYVVDSFVFGSKDWNETRLGDSDLFRRAPFDRDLVATILEHPAAWRMLPEYLTGFAKVNTMFRLGPDRTDAELTKFDRAYRPNDRIDQQRVEYLYGNFDGEALEHYLGKLRDLVARVQATGATMTILMMPTPPRYRDRLPDETAFQPRLRELVSPRGVSIVDHSTMLPDDKFYYDTDHLNRAGVEGYAEAGLVGLLRGEDT